MSWDIYAMEGNTKDLIWQPPACRAQVIPKRVSNVLVVGSVGSGKSNLIRSLFTRPELYGDHFDRIVLVSPTCRTDELQGQLNVADEDLIDDLDTAPAKLRKLMDDQVAAIEELGNDKAPVVALIFDDVVAHRELTGSSVFVQCFLANRHHNFTVFLASQQYNLIPKRIRLNAAALFYFSGSQAEDERIAEEFSIPGFSKNRMLTLVRFACREPHSFLHVNRHLPMKERFRKNLNEVIILDTVPESVLKKHAIDKKFN